MIRIDFPNGIFSEEILQSLPRDFTLIYDNKKYECNTSLAALLSPQIQIKMLSDVFLDSYAIPNLPDEITGDVEPISNFLAGHSFDISKEDVVFLFIVSSILGISQIESKLKEFLNDQLESASLEDIINQTIFLYKYNGDISGHVKLLSYHFFTKSSDDDEAEDLYKNIPIPILDLMFQQTSASIKNNEKAINFIIDIRGRLLRHIHLKSLTKDQLMRLIKETKNVNLNYMRKNLADYFNEINPKSPPPPTSKRFAFLGDSFTGIINYLAKKCKANPSSPKGDLIDVKSTHPIKGSYAVNNIFDFASHRSSFKTEANSAMSFTIDFRDSRVQVDAYTIKCFPQSQGSLQPTNWKISGSTNGENWDLIDEQRNIILEQCPDTTKTFVLLKKTNKYKFVKFDHPPIKNDKFGLCVSAFELFGVFYEK